MIRPNSGPGPVAGPGTSGDEFSVIDRLRRRFAPDGGPADGEVWIGDDAAVVRSPAAGPILLATDLVVAGVHVDLGHCSPADLGYKAVMVAVSDLAAMGGRPDHLLLSLAAPPGTDLDQVAEGVATAATATGCVVVGGDLSGAPTLTVSVAVSGSLHGPTEPGPLLRSGARSGDAVVLTGPLGSSAAGLRLLRAGWTGQPGGEGRDRGEGGMGDAEASAVRAHRRPLARLAEGEVGRLAGATAAIDISDGLAADLAHLATASGVGVRLDHLPVAGAATRQEAVGGGEEYELLLTTGDPHRLAAAFATAGLRAPIPIGWCTDRPGLLELEGAPLPVAGWRHSFR
jgi:thiamine-monophosphate kinase